jgi:FlaA1/EpsC-like NDP-sugar epimerase
MFSVPTDCFGLDHFVTVSSGKAVRPTSVVGVAKRVAELYVQAPAGEAKTRFATVRLGKELGSSGRVLPIFQEQIARGGPVTVTHPDMRC